MLWRHLRSASHQIDLLFRRRGSSLGLLLEGVQYMDGGLELDSVDDPTSVAIMGCGTTHGSFGRLVPLNHRSPDIGIRVVYD